MNKVEATQSKKRLLLEKNLKTVVKNVEMGTTPLRIAELWVYGSYIRPKEEPGDVDLEVFTRPDEELDEKLRLIQDFLHDSSDSQRELRKTVWDEALNGRVDTLVAALDRKFGRDERHRLWLEISRASWLYLARNMGVWSMNIDVHKIIRALLLGRSKTVHIEPTEGIKSIARKAETVSEKPHRLLWSEDSRDVDANLRLMYGEAQEAADKELPRFQLQFDQLDAEYSMIAAGIAYVLEEMKQGRDITKQKEPEIFEVTYHDPSWGSEANRLETRKVNGPMEAGMVAWARKSGVDDDFIGAALSASSYSFTQQFLPEKPARATLPQSSKSVEDLRRRSKDLTRKLPFARSIRSCMSNLGDRDEFSAKDPVVEAVYRAYVYTQMYLAPDEVRTEVLQDLGLGHIVIPKLSEKGQPFDRYGRPGEQR